MTLATISPGDTLRRETGISARAVDAAYCPWFDWLRGALAVTVMLYHDRVLTWEHAGGFAVTVFFALSGWLIGGILVTLSPRDLPRFYFNRAVRIWAPYYLAAALLLLASLLRDPVTGKWLEIVTYKLTFVYNLFGTRQLAEYVNAMPLKGTASHFWSVNAEEQFYLLAPLLLVLAARRYGRAPVLWVVLAMCALWFHLYAAIVLGVLAAVAVHRYGPLHLTIAGRVTLGVVLVASAIGLNVNYELAAPVCALAIVLLLAVGGRQHRFGEIAGGMSYPLYLNHWIGVFVFNFLLTRFGLRDSPLRHGLSALLNVSLAIALYWWVDRRLLASRGRWFTPERGWVTTVVAYAMVLGGTAFGLFMLGR